MKPNKLSFVSILLTILLTSLFYLVVFFILDKFILPKFQIPTQDVYNILLRVLPLLLVLGFIQVINLVFTKETQNLQDKVDELPPNSYPNMLNYVADDPLADSYYIKNPIETEETNDILFEVITNVDNGPFEIIKEVEKTVIVKEVIFESPVFESITNIVDKIDPIELPVEDEIEEVEDEIEEVEDEIEEVEDEIEEPVEDEIEEAPEFEDTIEAVEEPSDEEELLDFVSFLDLEIYTAKDLYDLTIVSTKDESLTHELAFQFDYEGLFYLVFPFLNKNEVSELITDYYKIVSITTEETAAEVLAKLK